MLFAGSASRMSSDVIENSLTFKSREELAEIIATKKLVPEHMYKK